MTRMKTYVQQKLLVLLRGVFGSCLCVVDLWKLNYTERSISLATYFKTVVLSFLSTTEQQRRRHPSPSTALRAKASHLEELHLMTVMMMMR